ncbi:MAG: ribonuclease P protein component [Ignavibacteria bacterium]|nr:ribonuclease P protein component [Ignavibacteria bacterium]
MKKKEVLRGVRRFRNIVMFGERFDGDLVRVFCMFCRNGGVAFRVGVAVRHKVGRAVQRSRLRRLMREAISRERTSLVNILEKAQLHASVVFLFVGIKDLAIEHVTLRLLQEDIGMVCRTLMKRVAAG